MHFCIAVGVANDFEILGGIGASRKTIRERSTLVTADCAQASCCSCSVFLLQSAAAIFLLPVC